MSLSPADFLAFERENLECFQMATTAIAQSSSPYPVGVLYWEPTTHVVKMVLVNVEAQPGSVRVLIGPESQPIDESTFLLSDNDTIEAKTLLDRTIRLIVWNRDKIA